MQLRNLSYSANCSIIDVAVQIAKQTLRDDAYLLRFQKLSIIVSNSDFDKSLQLDLFNATGFQSRSLASRLHNTAVYARRLLKVLLPDVRIFLICVALRDHVTLLSARRVSIVFCVCHLFSSQPRLS